MRDWEKYRKYRNREKDNKRNGSEEKMCLILFTLLMWMLIKIVPKEKNKINKTILITVCILGMITMFPIILLILPIDLLVAIFGWVMWLILKIIDERD